MEENVGKYPWKIISMKICKNCTKKEKNEADKVFSWNKFDNIRRKAFNDTNKIDDINIQTGIKIV